MIHTAIVMLYNKSVCMCVYKCIYMQNVPKGQSFPNLLMKRKIKDSNSEIDKDDDFDFDVDDDDNGDGRNKRRLGSRKPKNFWSKVEVDA